MRTVYIIKGTMGPEPHPGHKEGDLAWQFSDGPAGQRGSSDDYPDLLRGLVSQPSRVRFNIDEADFTPEENNVFLDFLDRKRLRTSYFVGMAPLSVVTSYKPDDTDGVFGVRKKGWYWHFSVELPCLYDGQPQHNGYVVQGPFDTEELALIDASLHLTPAYNIAEFDSKGHRDVSK